PFTLPGGQPVFSPPHDVYDASLRVDQRIVDPSLKPRVALARADLAEAQARLRTALFGLRQQVDDAFFAAALLQERIAALDAAIASRISAARRIGRSSRRLDASGTGSPD